MSVTDARLSCRSSPSWKPVYHRGTMLQRTDCVDACIVQSNDRAPRPLIGCWMLGKNSSLQISRKTQMCTFSFTFPRMFSCLTLWVPPLPSKMTCALRWADEHSTLIEMAFWTDLMLPSHQAPRYFALTSVPTARGSSGTGGEAPDWDYSFSKTSEKHSYSP
jgi:hypothetical protein